MALRQILAREVDGGLMERVHRDVHETLDVAAALRT
jgi:hypothetical protein